MRPGEIYWVDLPQRDGHEQHGRRPRLVFQDDRYANRLRVVLVIPLTSAKTKIKYPGTVFVPADTNNGLTADSVAFVFQLRALDRRRFESKLGDLDAAILQSVYDEFDRLTGHP